MFSRNEITTDAPPKRVHYPWHELEEYHPNGGMWAIPTALSRARFIDESATLMANPVAFAKAMRRALKEWPKSVSVALTTPGMNHRAWLGHAGCFLATGSPEEATRLGWHQLDDAEQWAANDAADCVIAEWRRANQPDPGVQMGLFDA
jgi:hypothetical protein